MLNIDQRALQRAPSSLANSGAQRPASAPFTRRPQLAKGQGRRQSAEAGRRSFLSETDLNWIKYCLQGGESLSEEVVPHFSQSLNAIFTYTRARRWEGRKKEKNLSLLAGQAETVPCQTQLGDRAAWGQRYRSSSLSTFALGGISTSKCGIRWEDFTEKKTNTSSIPRARKGS